MQPAVVLIVVFIALSLCISSLVSNQVFAQTMMSPRAQMRLNADVSQISCREGYVLLTKANGMPACVSPSSFLRLVDRGWGIWDGTMMMNRPQMMNNLLGEMIQNPQLMQHWHDMLLQNQKQMQEIRDQWIEKLKENPQLMANILGPLTTDPELREQTIDQLIQNREMMQSIRNNTGWMGMMRGSVMGQGMGQGMGPGMGMQGGCAWCPMASTPSLQYGTATCPWCPVTNQTMGTAWMMHNPQNIENMMHQMWINLEIRQQMNDMMIRNPWHIGPMMGQMMAPLINPIIDDPELRQQIIDMISQNQGFMQHLRESQSFAQSDVITTIERIEDILDQVSSSYRSGDKDTAHSLATSAYLENYEYIEGTITQKDRQLMEKIELMMRMDLRSMIQNGDTADNIDEKISSIKSELGNVKSLFQ